MKKWVVVFLVFALLLSVLSVTYAAKDDNDIKTNFHSAIEKDLKDSGKANVIVVLEDESVAEVRLQASKSSRTINAKSLPKLKDNQFSSFQGYADTLSEDELIDLSNDPRIKSIEPNFRMQAMLDTSVKHINATTLNTFFYNNTGLNGTGTSVCIVDTGIQSDHPAFAGRVVGGYCFCTYEGVDCCANGQATDTNYEDDESHGTHCAGIIGSANNTYLGVAPGVGIVAVKSLNSAGNGDSSGILLGMDWCVTNKNVYNITVISMSLGTAASYTTPCDSLSTSFHNAIENALYNNITVVIASGNGASTTGISLPACIDNATSVGGTDDSDNWYGNSNRAAGLDILAPGVSIASTIPGSAFGVKTGTSMATPHVAGVFALLKQYKILQNGSKGITEEELETAANSTGIPIWDGGSGRWYYRINAWAALKFLDSKAPSIDFNSNTPANATTTLQSSVVINISSSEFLSNVTLLWNGTPEAMNRTEHYFWAVKSGLEGSYTYTVYGNDSAGNIGYSLNRTITISNSNNLTGCVDITSSGDYYLRANITDSSTSKCINLIANNIVLDCLGNTIDGDDVTEWGIFTNRTNITDTNITIRNCTITNWAGAGIYIANGNGNLIENVNLSYNRKRGIFLLNVSSSTIRDSVIYNSTLNGDYGGIYCINCFNDTITSIESNYNKGYGLIMYYSSNNSIYNSRFYNNSQGSGIGLRSSSQNNTIYNISSDANLGGISIMDWSSNVVITNLSARNNLFGIYIQNMVEYITISDVSVENSTSEAIYLGPRCNFINITYAHLYMNVQGIESWNASNVTIRDSTISFTKGEALYIRPYDEGGPLLTEIYNMTVFNNTYGLRSDIFIDSQIILINSSIFNNTYNIYNDNITNLTFENNYWGTTNSSEISNLMFDFYDNQTFGIIDYSPWYLDSSYTLDSDFDNDGYSNSSLGGIDCNDASASTYPGATELDDGIDQNCENDAPTLTAINLSYLINQNANFTVNITDYDNSSLKLSLNDSRFTQVGNYFNRTVNSSASGTYWLTVNTSDGASTTSAVFTVYFQDLMDTDGDGTPDINDTDDDNDGIADATDTLTGNSTHINSTSIVANVSIDNSTSLTEAWTGTRKVEIKNNNTPLVTFAFDFDSYTLILSNISINFSSSGNSVVIRGIPKEAILGKNITLPISNPSIESVCVKDSDIVSISELSASCNGTDEFLLKCDGTNTTYNCTMDANYYYIDGLNHSGITPLCPDDDKDGYFASYCGGTDCLDTNSAVNPGATEVCGDSLDNDCNSATSDTCAVAPSGGSGGGGGSGFASSSTSSVKATQYYGSLLPETDTKMNINKNQISFTSMEFKVEKALSKVTLTVTIESNLSKISSPVENAYEYVWITKENLEDKDLSGVVKISFKVNKTWLKSYDKNNILLKRYSGSSWRSLTTTFEKEDNYYAYYSAISPGFSLFSIAAKKVVVETPVIKETIEEEKSNESMAEVVSEIAETDTTSFEMPKPEKERMSLVNYLIIVGIILLSFVLIAAIIFYKGKGPKSHALNLFCKHRIHLIKSDTPAGLRNNDIAPPKKPEL